MFVQKIIMFYCNYVLFIALKKSFKTVFHVHVIFLKLQVKLQYHKQAIFINENILKQKLH